MNADRDRIRPAPAVTEAEGARSEDLSPRARELFEEHRDSIFRQTDGMFRILLLAQWVFALVVAVTFSPFGWSGKVHAIHLHVQTALFIGGLINCLPLLLIAARPGWWGTRQVIAAAQMLWSALLIHLTGGRIETHFHVFGSLAFLAFYRDWRILPTATVVVAADHLIRGILWPESVYGVLNPEWWRFLEHAFWVAFEDAVLVFSCLRGVREMKVIAGRRAAVEELHASVELKVVERTAELEASREQYRALVETANVVPWEMDPVTGQFVYIGPQVERLLGFPRELWTGEGFWRSRIHPDDLEGALAAHREGAASGGSFEVEYRLMRADGKTISVREAVTAVVAPYGRSILRGLIFDITERKRLERDLNQSQRLESVGRLAAGVAHEINTPVQFVSDSVHFVRGAYGDFIPLLESYERLRKAVGEGVDPRPAAAEALQAREEADLDYLLEHVPKALERSLEGLNRVASIVGAMKDFAHPDQREMKAVDLNQAVQSTLIITRNEYKFVAEVETDFGTLPPVVCNAGEVNQAVLNILVNASHAIADVVHDSGTKGRIRVTTRQEGEFAVISISDTGGGIPEALRDRIFDPFFTTKEVGKGTGQGLSIARSVIHEKHGGEVTFESETGKGTTFFIRLPIEGWKSRPVEVARAA